ncbi:carboxymuconolactone decarboxylase family protein [Cellulosilyticum sp. I15G10I2]|uniref:carboxymuconolactone decarboxylase family protein n=1 Tax=Cellulosilyticum sp. I15G10I2 TaxID=1892843 RepID=UPI00085CC397|nr:carboxymuconolactone decarboxylase family protein [Cellulosilyticum sp. I15G10I2]
MNKNPLEIIQKNDEELFNTITASRALAFKESTLPLKEKLLIALALDASHGAVDGVKTLAKRAIEAGASKEEIMDTLRVTYFISGVGSIYTAARALEELFS